MKRIFFLRRYQLVFLLPVIAFAGLAAVFGVGLYLRPDIIPSPLIDQDAPLFTLKAIPGRDDGGLTNDDLKGHGVTIVNVFASWCIPCRAEHPLLLKLAKEDGVRVVGINYKDKPDEVNAWLAELGNPFSKIGRDDTGRVAIDWGVYGVPESFIVDDGGHIRYKQTGPMMDYDVEKTILPMIRKLQK
ncbi:MAG TPA: DsbE family thiol:disulfide interchange protein [Alphaproteobacteria bacterium]|jgi:cytochrome c biogenesis protein CcmG/thiol:disulfide interchange protein DsbE